MLQRGLEFENDGWRIFLDTVAATWPALAAGQNLFGFVAGVPNIKNSSTTYELVTPTGTQTLTNKTLTSPTINGGTASGLVLTAPQINDTTADHQYIVAVSELAADRNITLPLLTGNDVFVFADFIQTLTNKTFNLTSNTLTGTLAQFNTAVSDADLASLAGTETLTNKRITPRIFTLTDAATIAVNADTTDIGVVTLGGNRTLGNPSGTPTDGQELIIRVRQDGTGTRTLAYDTQYRFTGAVAPTVTSTANETSYLRFMYHSADVKWDLISSALDFRA